ncbi:YcjX family protein [Gallaecimonas xiamenensis]|uniref:Conserved protein YcjX with nucleoside triphosphate hydrolase domain n=1 Tax=Gallaecimonas xiamenensis 3-C-1 TaxID=745411 RepID=K2J084_9GAMM|nr:YcjX family protein [Gallaecimonas xiamenensis]EKE76281.1 Conserved protein YcjX with nucleoside triphosphate hydrolase domain [Gallaecimonas xiamenensis 3-C-1]
MLDSSTLKTLARAATDTLKRGLDQHVRLAVTGLSQAGKTAFITSLTDQLLHGTPRHLPFFPVQAEGRYLGAKEMPQPHPLVPRFRYRDNLAMLQADQPGWAPSTQGISELRLHLKYQPDTGIRGFIKEPVTLVLDIVDYPGEWLLDLGMLDLDYGQWSAQQQKLLAQKPRADLAASWCQDATAYCAQGQSDEVQTEQLAERFAALLQDFRASLGLYYLQPGRFLLPGELKGAPVLAFFPWQGAPDDSPLYRQLAKVFEQYKSEVVKRFYRDHFASMDRQVVLVDTLAALNHSRAAFLDLQLALTEVLKSFQYGQSGLLSRLFSPRIDKVLFAATQADRLTPDQRPALTSLIGELIGPALEPIRFAGIDVGVETLAAVCTTQAGKGQLDGQTLPCLKGRLADGRQVTLFPGDVPASLPAADFWQRQGFAFPGFAPPLGLRSPLAHLRMDKALAFLLGDKML